MFYNESRATKWQKCFLGSSSAIQIQFSLQTMEKLFEIINLDTNKNVSKAQELWLAMPPVIKLKIEGRKQVHIQLKINILFKQDK